MIECPRCGGANTRTVTKGTNRPMRHRRAIIRTHECSECGLKFLSYQLIPTTRAGYDLVADFLEGVA